MATHVTVGSNRGVLVPPRPRTARRGAQGYSAFIVSYPHHGVLVDGPQNETLTYTPDPGYVGTDTFIYTAYDGQADSHPVTVTITVAAQT